MFNLIQSFLSYTIILMREMYDLERKSAQVLGISCRQVDFTLFIGHEGPQGEQRYTSTLPSTSALDGGGWSTPSSGRFTPGKDPVPIVQEAGQAPGLVWTGAENLGPTGIRSPDGPARSQSLYRLRYPPPYCIYIYICLFIYLFIYLYTYKLIRGRYSAVFIATRYGLDGRRFEARQGEVIFFTPAQLGPGTNQAAGGKSAPAWS